MAVPSRQTKPRNPDDDAADTQHRVAALETKPARKTIGNSDDLGDVEALYENDERRPKHGQTWRFDSARPGKYHGLWVPSGGERITGRTTLTVTSDGLEAGATQRLVPDDWDPRIGCTGVAWVTIGPVDSVPGVGTDPPPGFLSMLQVIPWDIAAGAPTFDTISEDDVMPADDCFGAGNFGKQNHSVPADLRAGIPHAFVYVKTPAGVGPVDFDLRWLIRPDGPL